MPAKRGLGTTYISMNFNKSGLVLDLKKPEDRARAHGLAAEADIFIENFRPGVADRIGVGYAELSKLNPRLVYASASGFGPKGPMVKIGATDPHLQPFTGSCSVNGEAGGKMQSWRWYGHFDCTTAMCITEGVLSALIERETTGRGKLIQVTMIEAAMALQRVRMSEHLAGQTPKPMGSASAIWCPTRHSRPRTGRSPSRRARAASGSALCEALGRPALADDPRFARNPDRVKNRDGADPDLAGDLRKILRRASGSTACSAPGCRQRCSPASTNSASTGIISRTRCSRRSRRRNGAKSRSAACRGVSRRRRASSSRHASGRGDDKIKARGWAALERDRMSGVSIRNLVKKYGASAP